MNVEDSTNNSLYICNVYYLLLFIIIIYIIHYKYIYKNVYNRKYRADEIIFWMKYIYTHTFFYFILYLTLPLDNSMYNSNSV